MERMDAGCKNALIPPKSRLAVAAVLAAALVSAAVGVSFPVYAQEGEAGTEREPAQAPAAAEAPKLPAAIVPELSFRARDGKMLAQMMQKNKWFTEFRQTPFYQGAVGKIAPVIFSPADDFGSMANAWQGRLLDYLYEKVLENKPVAVHVFRRSRLISPFVMTVSSLGKGESAVAEKLISILKSSEPVKYSYRDAGEIAVTPLLVKQQKFGAVLQNNCLTIGRDPEAVASASYWCRQAVPIKSDAEIQASLDEFFPALRGVREKFLGLQPGVHVEMKWQPGGARFAIQNGSVEVVDSALHQGQIPDELVKAVPSDAVFFSSALVPMPASGFSPDGLKKYFQAKKTALKSASTLPVSLVYIPLPASEGPKFASALLMYVPKSAPAVHRQLAASFAPTKKRETFVRQTCAGVVAMSDEKKALEALEAVCKKQRPSFSQMADKWLAPLKGKNLSGAVYVSPGRLLSLQMERGWKGSKDTKETPVVDEIKTARRLVEELPSYLLTGTVNAKVVSLKAVE